jgi:8-oxo-dGTP diphosphatase
MPTQKNAYMDVNPVIVTSEGRIFLAKRAKNVVGGSKWHLPGGRVLHNETIEQSLRRVAFDKTSLQIKLRCSSLEESLVGIYDNPKRDPREHVIGFAFLCRIIGGAAKPGRIVEEIQAFSEDEIKGLEFAFDHMKMVNDAFTILGARSQID